MATASCKTLLGVVSVAGRVPWTGSTAKPKDVNWIPSATVRVLNENGTMARPWYLFFQEITRRLGGISAESLPQVSVKQDQVNAYLVDVQSGVTGMGVQVSAITETVNTQTEVAQTNDLSGSD
jgi:hypothetical protein